MTKPSLELRRLSRIIARESLIKSGGDVEKAERIFKADPRLVGIDPATVIFLLKIAYDLWKWWKSRQIDEPSIVAMSNEPIDLETEDDD